MLSIEGSGRERKGAEQDVQKELVRQAIDLAIENIHTGRDGPFDDALFIVIHDSAKPASTLSDWKPKGSCEK
jgi:hypothetical protein